MVAKVNIVESNNKGHKKKFDGQQQQNKNQKKFKSYCYNCGKPNHMAKNCMKPKKGKEQVNIVQENLVLFYFF